MNRKRQERTKVRSERTSFEKSGDRFFAKELEGEEALSRNTAESLYAAAAGFMLLRPWEFLSDSELILIDDTESGERCYCCIMGAAGEWFGMHVYQGEESYRLHRFLARGNTPDPYSFYEKQKGVQLELVMLEELEKADRNLLEAFAHPLKRGHLAPQFRALRPGFEPWFVNEQEGRLLLKCLQSVITFCEKTTDEELDGFWLAKDTYPLIDPGGEGASFGLGLVTAPEPPPLPPEMPEMDEDRIQRIGKECTKRGGILEASHFFAPGTIGRKHERKACMHLSLLADADTGLLHMPEVGVAGEMGAAVVCRTLLGVMENEGVIPQEVRVAEQRLATGLGPLGVALGFEVKNVKRLPTVEEAKTQLFQIFLGQRPRQF